MEGTLSKEQIVAAWREYLIGLGAIDACGDEFYSKYKQSLAKLGGYSELAEKFRRNPEFAGRTDEEIIDLYESISHEEWIKGLCVSDKVAEMEKFLSLIGSHSSILDLGCGPCIPLSFLKSRGIFDGLAIGMDPSNGMIQTARKTVEELGVDIELIQGWMQDIPLEDESIDVIHCVDVLHWTNRWRTAIKEMVRVANDTVYIVYGHSNRVQIPVGDLVELLVHLGMDIQDYAQFSSKGTGMDRYFITATKTVNTGKIVMATSF